MFCVRTMRSVTAAVLLALTTFSASQPAAAAASLSLSLLSHQLPQSGDGKLKVSVVDTATGEAVLAEAVVTLEAIRTPRTVQMVDKLMTRTTDGIWAAELFQNQKQIGTYRVTVSASSGDSRGSLTTDVVITGRVELSDIKAAVEGGSSRDTQPLTLGQSMSEPLSLQPGIKSKAVFTFTVTQADASGFSPHQAMVRATHVASGAAVFVRGRAADDGYHRITFNNADINAQADGRGGLYDLSLLVADAAIENPTQWTFGQIDVLAGTQLWKATSAAKPEIHHVFRQPDKRTSPVISVFFATLQVALLAGLLVVVRTVTDARLAGVPRTAGGWSLAVLFHCCLIVTLLLLLAFWIDLTILQLVPVLAVAAPVTAGCGYMLLSHLATSQYRESRTQLKTE